MRLRTLTIFLILCTAFPSILQAEKKALLIGISDYLYLPSQSDSGIADLRGPSNDIQALKKLLFLNHGFEKKNIRVLKDKQATRSAIEQSITSWLALNAGEDDIILIYFSGHGSRVVDQNGDEKDGWDEVLCPYDMIPRGGKNIIVDDELGQWLSMFGKAHVCVIVDSCNSGGVTRGVGDVNIALGATPAKGTRFIPITDYSPRILNKGISTTGDIPEDVIFLAASREDEVALEIRMSDGFHGGFSYSLFKGIAEIDQPDYEKLYTYASRFLKDYLQLPQEPQLIAKKEKVRSIFLGSHTSARLTELSGNVPDPQSIKPRTLALQKDPENKDSHLNASPLPGHKTREAGKVFVAIDDVDTGNGSGLSIVLEKMQHIPFVSIVKPDAYFDRLVKRCNEHHSSCVLFTNRVGDQTHIDISGTDEMIYERVKGYLKYADLENLFVRLRPAVSSFAIKVRVKDENRRDFKVGENIVFEIHADRDCHVLFFNLDGHGRIHILFPNKFQQDDEIRAGTMVYVPSDSQSGRIFPIEIQPPAGTEMLKAIATTHPLGLHKHDFEPGSMPDATIEKTTGKFIETLVKKLSEKDFQWSEDTLVLRSHGME